MYIIVSTIARITLLLKYNNNISKTNAAIERTIKFQNDFSKQAI